LDISSATTRDLGPGGRFKIELHARSLSGIVELCDWKSSWFTWAREFERRDLSVGDEVLA